MCAAERQAYGTCHVVASLWRNLTTRCRDDNFVVVKNESLNTFSQNVKVDSMNIVCEITLSGVIISDSFMIRKLRFLYFA